MRIRASAQRRVKVRTHYYPMMRFSAAFQHHLVDIDTNPIHTDHTGPQNYGLSLS